MVCGGIGLVNGLLIARGNMAPFIVTLAALLGARGLLLAITDEGATTYLVPKDSAFGELGQGSVWGFGYPIWIALVLFAAGAARAAAHPLRAVPVRGRRQRGRGRPDGPPRRPHEDPRLHAQRPARRPRRRAQRGLARPPASPSSASGMELDAISAVVIGGTLLTGGAGSISGTLVGVLLLAVIQNVINQIGSLNSSYQ